MSLRAKLSPCAKESISAKVTLRAIVSRCAKVSHRAKVTLRAIFSSRAKLSPRAKVTLCFSHTYPPRRLSGVPRSLSKLKKEL